MLLATIASASGAAAVAAQPAPSGHPSGRQQARAVDALDSLTVKGRAPKTGYSRDRFGTPWTDVDGNGCDTRNDILRRDLTRLRLAGDCVVRSGDLSPDPYTGKVHHFTLGHSTVDIDHVVALGDAWQKGDGDAATWLPSNKAYRCAYVARQLAVKLRYGLWATSAEKAAIGRVLSTCPRQRLPR